MAIPFPEPFQIVVEGNGCKLALSVQQQINESIRESKFSSVGNTSFQLTFYINRDERKPSRFSVSYQLNNAKNVLEGVEALKLYNAFAMGDGRIDGKLLIHNSVSQPIPDRTISFWERVAEIEKVCKISFKMKTDDISLAEGMDIERLYQNLVLKQPIKEWHQIDSISIPGAGNDIQEIKKGASCPLAAFQYETSYIVDVLGQELKLPSIACSYNISYKIRKVSGKDEYKITFMNNDQRFTSCLSFADRSALELYITENPDYANIIQDCVDVKQEMLLREQA